MLHKRLLAAATATFLALGMAVGGASPAMANNGGSDAGTPCSTLGYEKPSELDNLPDDSSGDETYEWGSVSWDSPNVTVTVNAGYVVDFCVKGGNTAPTTSGDITGPDTWEYQHNFGLSHMGFTFDEVEPELVEPGATPTPENCLDGDGTITFSSDPGVTYTVDGISGTFNPGDQIENLSAGDYDVTATPDDGYELDGEAEFTVTVESTSILCELPLVAASASASPENCLDGNGSITFAGDEGVTFTVDGVVGTFVPGDILDGLAAGDYDVTAVPPTGSAIDGDAEFTVTVESTEIDCDLPLVEAAVGTEPTNCVDGEGVILFQGDEGVTYTVDGQEGTFESGDSLDGLDAGDYTVRAFAPEGSALDGDGVFEVEVEFEFVDCLPTEGTASVAFDWEAPSCELGGSVTVSTDLTSNATAFEPDFDSAAASTQFFYFVADEDATFSASEPPVLNPASGAGAPTIVDWEIYGDGRFLMVEISVPGADIELCLPTLGTASVGFDWTPATCLVRQNVTPNAQLLSNATQVGQPVFANGKLTYVFAAADDATFSAAEPPTFSPAAGAPAAVSTLSEDNTRLTVEIAVAPVKTENCDLTTLAITGASNALSGLGMVAVLIMMAGTGLVVARRREAARIQG